MDDNKTLLTVHANVFVLDRTNHESWGAISISCVPIAICYDAFRGLYRIFSMEGSRVIVNSIITSTTEFIQTSLKFGHWTEEKTKTVYGIGFHDIRELSKFVETFARVKLKISQTSKSVNEYENTKVSQFQRKPQYMVQRAERTQDIPSSFSPRQILTQYPSESSRNKINSIDFNPQSQLLALSQDNRRLKQALAESAGNVSKWEAELTNLRESNKVLYNEVDYLTGQVEEWKKSSSKRQEENQRRSQEFEQVDVNVQDQMDSQLRQQIQEIQNSKNYYQQIVKEQEEELRQMKNKNTENGNDFKKENEVLRIALTNTRNRVQQIISTTNTMCNLLINSDMKLLSVVHELETINEQLNLLSDWQR